MVVKLITTFPFFVKGFNIDVCIPDLFQGIPSVDYGDKFP